MSMWSSLKENRGRSDYGRWRNGDGREGDGRHSAVLATAEQVGTVIILLYKETEGVDNLPQICSKGRSCGLNLGGLVRTSSDPWPDVASVEMLVGVLKSSTFVLHLLV